MCSIELIADENAVLTSSFRRDAVTGHPASISISDKITFRRTICTTDQDGKYTLTEQGATEQGFLARDTLFLSAADRGKTKDVYLVSGHSHTWFFFASSFDDFSS